jgi:hypothetical protein
MEGVFFRDKKDELIGKNSPLDGGIAWRLPHGAMHNNKNRSMIKYFHFRMQSSIANGNI